MCILCVLSLSVDRSQLLLASRVGTDIIRAVNQTKIRQESPQFLSVDTAVQSALILFCFCTSQATATMKFSIVLFTLALSCFSRNAEAFPAGVSQILFGSIPRFGSRGLVLDWHFGGIVCFRANQNIEPQPCSHIYIVLQLFWRRGVVCIDLSCSRGNVFKAWQ